MEMRDVYRKRMRGMHPDLIDIIETTADRLPFAIGIPKDGHLRTEAEQRRMVETGASQTMNSRHRTGHAVDLFAEIDGKDVWTKPHSRIIAEMMQAVATEKGINITWGGTWKSGDTPHFELSWDDYPKQDISWHAAPPPPSRVTEAVKESKTIWGALLAMLGLIFQWFADAVGFAAQFATDAVAAISGLSPITSLATSLGANLPALGVGMSVVGIVTVIARRLDAAAKGKIG